MKKIVFIAIIALSFGIVSCKKNRTCTCTVKKTWSSDVDVEVTTYENVRKKQAMATCTSGTSYSDPSRVEIRTCNLN